jgi:prepilin-type N-terminal cleavage/methylation domain-containing protein
MDESRNRETTNRARAPVSRGFTLVEVLTVATMISILATMAVVSTRGGKRIAYETRAIAAMKNIGENEAIYYSRKRAYGSWDQLRAEGDLVDLGYARVDDLSNPADSPMAYLYSIAIGVSSTGQCFTAVALPMERSLWHLRTFATTCDGGIMNSKDQSTFFSTLIIH